MNNVAIEQHLKPFLLRFKFKKLEFMGNFDFNTQGCKAYASVAATQFIVPTIFKSA